ncbi:MAG: hypothetical protein Q8O52_03785 [Sulfuritalea sp.]|nr:hypothetical protein [Sulfuritalea sp.]
MTNSEPPVIGFRPFLVMSLVWLALAYLAGQQIASLPFGFVVISVLIFAVPVALSGAYSSAVNQTRVVSYYKTSGRAYKLLSGRVIRSFLWVIWALTTSFFMLLQFSTYSSLEWVALVLVVPVYWLAHQYSHRFLSVELKKRYVITDFSIVWARLWCPAIMVVVYAGLILAFSSVQNYASLSEALAAKRSGIPEIAGSAVAQVALRLMSFADGIKAYLAGDLKQFGEYLPLLLKVIGGYVVFFNACATFACFVIPSREYRRIFGPVSDDDTPAPLPKNRVALASALITFVAIFVYVPLFAQLEKWTGDHPNVIGTIKKVERQAERIDGELYNPGTIEKLEVAKAGALEKLNVSRAKLDGQIDRAFDQMENNVDRYLDWYYSLMAEYVRLAKLMTGEIEGYMERKLYEQLQQGEAFKVVSDAIAAALASHKNVMAEYHQTVKAIKDASRMVLPTGAEAKVVKDMSLNDILSLPTHLDVVAFEGRAAGGAVATGVSAAIAAKVASKGVFKAAAKALSKMAVSKATAVVGGAALGAAIGSVLPGVGTVAIGALGGLIGGLAVDGALLKLEEVISRDEFKKEILVAIREARVAFKARLFGAP